MEDSDSIERVGGGAGRGARILRWRRPGAGPYEHAFQRALRGALVYQRQVEGQRASAHRLAADLLRQAPGRRELLVRNHPAFGGWWLAALLADAAESGGHTGGEDLHLASLATEAAAALGPAGAGAALAEDVNARSWRVLADAQRKAGDLDAAADSLARARRHQRRGTREPLERAALLESSGLLLAARGRGRAAACLAAAASLYARLRERHAEGRARITLGLLADDPGQAAVHLRRGLECLDAAADRGLAARARRRLAALRPPLVPVPPGLSPLPVIL
jgi:hypothetical protein